MPAIFSAKNVDAVYAAYKENLNRTQISEKLKMVVDHVDAHLTVALKKFGTPTIYYAKKIKRQPNTQPQLPLNDKKVQVAKFERPKAVYSNRSTYSFSNIDKLLNKP